MAQLTLVLEDDYGCKAILKVKSREEIVADHQQKYIKSREKSDIGDFKNYLSNQENVEVLSFTLL